MSRLIQHLRARRQSLFLWMYNLLSPFSGRIHRIKILLLKLAGVKIGSGCAIGPFVRIERPCGGDLVIGERVWICSNVFIQCGTRIVIGNDVEVNYRTLLSANFGAELCIEDNCHIAHFCSLKCSTQIIDPSLKSGSIVGGSEFKSIHIGRGSWIGANAVILPGVDIGAYNVVAAGAVVTKSSPKGVLLAGVPAAIKKNYLGGDEKK